LNYSVVLDIESICLLNPIVDVLASVRVTEKA